MAQKDTPIQTGFSVVPEKFLARCDTFVTAQFSRHRLF
jgi:hypothetical protein